MSHEAGGKRDATMYYGRVNEILPSGNTEDFVIRSIDREVQYSNGPVLLSNETFKLK